jgi:hypothetical protein
VSGEIARQQHEVDVSGQILEGFPQNGVFLIAAVNVPGRSDSQAAFCHRSVATHRDARLCGHVSARLARVATRYGAT